MNNSAPTTDEAAKILWGYAKMNTKLQPANAIVAMGSMDMRVAERAANLWHQDLAPVIVVTGGLGRLTGTDTATSEAQKFAEILAAKNVPESAIVIEDKATNGAENFTFSINSLKERGIIAEEIIAVTQPYMERRAYATGKKLFPAVDIQMASPEISYDEYPTADVPKDLMINIIVGELYRIQHYPKKGFTIVQDIPADVLDAMQVLVNEGYTEQMPK